MSKCPTCGHDPDKSQQSRAAKSRWEKLAPVERKAEMSRRRKKGLKKKPNG